MAHKIAIYNKKGGPGKTSISVNLAAAIATYKQRRGEPGDPYRVLLLDLDPQGNSSGALLLSQDNRGDGKTHEDHGDLMDLFQDYLHKKDKPGFQISDVISIRNVMYTYKRREYVKKNSKGDDIHEDPILKDVDENGKEIYRTLYYRLFEVPNFSVAPSPQAIGDGIDPVTREFNDEDEIRSKLPVTLLSEVLKLVEPDFDFILMDCAPSWDKCSKMAIYAADQLIIPLEPGPFELDGIVGVGEKLGNFEKQFGRRPMLIFAVFNKLRNKVKGHLEYMHRVSAELGKRVCKVGIPFTKEMMESHENWAPFCFHADDYPDMSEIFLDIFKEMRNRIPGKEAALGNRK